LRVLAALRADDVVHFAPAAVTTAAAVATAAIAAAVTTAAVAASVTAAATAAVATGLAAGRAALGLVSVALLGVVPLVVRAERERLIAVQTGECSVLIAHNDGLLSLVLGKGPAI